MKTLLHLMVFITMAAFQVNAQPNTSSSPLTDRDFWKTNPSLDQVKAEVKKGFDFAEVAGMSDPISLSIVSDANPEVIKYLIDQPGVDLKHLTVEGRIYLHWAANKGNAEITDYLIKKGSDMDFMDSHGHTALTFAGFQGHLNKEVIDVFINNGLDIKKKYESKEGADILLLSIPYDKDLVITDYLVSKGLSINTTDNNGYTAFTHAAKIGNVSSMKKLLERGVKYDDDVLLVASQGTYRTANSIEVYKYLVDDLKINPKITSKDGRNVLHSIAGKKEQEEIVKYFLEKGVDVNQVDNEGNTPFINAANGQSAEVVSLMLPHLKKKTINKTNKEGQTALMLAMNKNQPDAVSLLLKNGADISIKDTKGNDVGYYLVESYRVPGGRHRGNQNNDAFNEKVSILKSAGYNFNSKQEKEQSLLHFAATKNDLKLIKTLVEAGANVNTKDANGTTPLHLAAMKATDGKILTYLISAGANKQDKTGFDETAYDLALENEALNDTGLDLHFLQ